MEVIPDPAPQIRGLIKEFTTTVLKGESTAHVHTALVFVVDTFCKATDTPIEDFYSNLVALRNKKKNPCG